ncbi:chromate transporter [Clostridium tarantellae]|uniref:Chromate transporter n=1 Tax=Clostridium tarantellae TaxID=39493 RepID=A0A6I1MRL8_9CLOT|nr:chromate transporter [Clostridium tarantellae]MPQ44832.1 chromate transporter [Clostridium tarantellae]
MAILLKLFFSFLKIGTFSFGGGYAMLPFMSREVVTNNHWLSKLDFLDIIGISQMTPGPVSINTATFVGYKMAGVIGSLISTLGVIIISFILVLIVSKILNKFKANKSIQAALIGMKPVLIALIINAFISLAKDSYTDIKSVIITIIIAIMLLSKKIHPIICILFSSVLGIIFYI